MPENHGYYSSAKNSTLAIISLVAGLLGVTFFPLIGSLVAVIVGPMAKSEIDESGGTLGGENLAQIGIIFGWIGLGFSLIGLCIAVGIIGLSLMTILFGLGVEEFGLVLHVFQFI